MKQLQTYIDKNRANALTASQAQSKQKQLDRIELENIVAAEDTARIRLPQIVPPRKTVLTCTDLHIGYGDHVVAREINFTLEPQARLLIAGDNGQGKTTLLKTLTGGLAPLRGTITWGYHCAAGVYAQHVYEALPAALTVREYLDHCNRDHRNDKEVMNLAGGFLFGGADTEKRIHVLSGGERARLCLAGLFLAGDNVLVLDEPSNHLDYETATALAAALTAYHGAVIFVSHERNFAAQVATGVIEIKDGKARQITGGFADYWRELETENAATTNPKPHRSAAPSGAAAPAPGAATRTTAPPPNSPRKLAVSKQLNALERKLAQLETAIAAATAALEQCAADWQHAAALQKTLATLIAEKTACEEEWLALSLD